MAARTALVTDSTCNLSLELAAERGICVVPLYLLWGEESYRDGVDIQKPEFYARLRTSDDIPKTSQVTPQDFATAFETARAEQEADEVVCAVISSELSGTYASAVQAQQMVDFPVHVIDTLQTSWALGHVMLTAAEQRDQGASPAAIAQGVRESAQRQRLIFTVDSLEHLQRGGRIGSARRLLGTALSIKPVLVLREGVVHSADNVRTRKRALDYLVKVAEAAAEGRPVRRLSGLHTGAEDEAQAVLEQAVAKLKPAETYMDMATVVLGVHTGPGAVGLVVEWET